MRNDKYKQCACIAETNPQIFQEKLNAILSRINNPEIVLDRTQPFTCYVFYNINRDTPESLLELLEMLDGQLHTCEECPYFIRSTDKRRRRHTCGKTGTMTRADSRACEDFYRMKRDERKQLVEEYTNTIPYTIE